MTYKPASDRYDSMEYRRTGRSGLKLPAVSLGLWHNFGDVDQEKVYRATLLRAFDLGITHFDLANNYGPPFGSAETNFGKIMASDFKGLRRELVISTKAGWDMWPGPYGDHGSRKYLLTSLEESLTRMGLDYVDIFYSHRFDPETPLEETMGALAHAVHTGKALYAGISSYSPERTRQAAAILKDLDVPLLIHQPSYSMLNRWVEKDLLSTLDDIGAGCIAFTPLAQGLLTNKYLGKKVPKGSRADRGGIGDQLTEDNLERIRGLDKIASERGQTLAQMAMQWVLRDSRVTSALVGASSVKQLEENVAALSGPDLTDAELAKIDQYAVDGGVNWWAESGEG